MGTAIKPLRTLLEVFQSLPEGTLAQLIQNELIMSPSPFDVHQQVLISLAAARYDLEEKKKVYEQYGVKEYTIIDPAIKSVTVYTREKIGYSISFAGTQIVRSSLLNNSFEF